MSPVTIVDDPPTGSTAGEVEAGETVAERFAYFLEVTRLDRESFVAAVDDAIGARSLYSVLSGQRRPSRALAVLIERTWGFRADFLLDGTGPMWATTTRADTSPDGLSASEREVVDFMRGSIENAKTIRIELEKARLWRHIFERTLVLLDGLERRRDDSGDDDATALIGLVLDDSHRSARIFERYLVALHRRRTMRLTVLFLDRYLDPTGLKVGRTARRAVTDARREVSAAVRDTDTEIAVLRERLDAIATMAGPEDLVGTDRDAAVISLVALVSAAL